MQNKKYQLLIFDWDGTLLDSAGVVAECVRLAAKKLHLTPPSTEKIHKYFGLPTLEFAQGLFPNTDATAFAKAFYAFFTEEKRETHFFPGTVATLYQLKKQGFTLAIATNTPRLKLKHALMQANLTELFTATRCPDEGFAKPHPWMVLDLLEELMIAPQNALMIGDTIFDMQLAQNAGVDALAVTYGNNNHAKLAAYLPVGFLDDIQKLPQLAENLARLS